MPNAYTSTTFFTGLLISALCPRHAPCQCASKSPHTRLMPMTLLSWNVAADDGAYMNSELDFSLDDITGGLSTAWYWIEWEAGSALWYASRLLTVTSSAMAARFHALALRPPRHALFELMIAPSPSSRRGEWLPRVPLLRHAQPVSIKSARLYAMVWWWIVSRWWCRDVTVIFDRGIERSCFSLLFQAGPVPLFFAAPLRPYTLYLNRARYMNSFPSLIYLFRDDIISFNARIVKCACPAAKHNLKLSPISKYITYFHL